MDILNIGMIIGMPMFLTLVGLAILIKADKSNDEYNNIECSEETNYVIDDIVNKIAIEIGYFYYNKTNATNEDDKIEKANLSICNLGITKIDYNDNNDVIITLTRPGLLIGIKGSNINALTKYLKDNLDEKINEINLIEIKHIQNLFAFRVEYDYKRRL